MEETLIFDFKWWGDFMELKAQEFQALSMEKPEIRRKTILPSDPSS